MTTKEDLGHELDQLRQQLERTKLPPNSVDDLLGQIQRLRHQVEVISSSDVDSLDLMELEGVGEDFWQSIDAEDYLRQERASWR